VIESKKVIGRKPSPRAQDDKASPHVIGVRVDKVSRLDIGDNGEQELVLIEPKDWKKTQYYFPSKTVRWQVISTKEAINAGSVIDLPTETHKTHVRKKRKTGGVQPIYPYYEGPDDKEICQYVLAKDIFELNIRHPFVAKYFLCTVNFVKGSKQHQLRMDLFFTLKSIARNMASLYKNFALWSARKDPVPTENEIINELVRCQIESNPLILNVCKALDKKIDEQS
jgi:hypothetical protein